MSGDTRRRQDTVEVLFGAMEDAGLSVLNDSAETEGGRDSFTMTLQAKRQQREN